MMGTPELLVICIGVAAVILGTSFILFRRRQTRRSGCKTAASSDLEQALRLTLGPTRKTLLERVRQLWTSSSSIETRLAQLEDVLIAADVGVNVTRILLDRLKMRGSDLPDAERVRDALRQDIRAMLPQARDLDPPPRPRVILVAGVNGVGKTTSIGKLAHYHIRQGRKVLLVAADTFRAAAGEQLQLWATRVGADCVRHQDATDPSAVAFDGVKAGIARGVDVVIIDTAGRLHVKANLIEELKKVVRVVGRQQHGAPHEVFLVVDATTGQNALNQAQVFQEALSLTGIILTKLDGTAKGGVVLAISLSLGLPIRYVGYGERADEFAPFDPDAFVDALLEPPGNIVVENAT